MISVTASCILQSDSVKIVNGKTGQFAFFVVRDNGNEKYDCYAFGEACENIMRMPLKGGDLIIVQGELHKKDAKYLVPDEKWKKGFPDEPNPTKYRNPFFKVFRVDYAIPSGYRASKKAEKEEPIEKPRTNVLDMLQVKGFGEE